MNGIPKRKLGKTGFEATVLGLGGVTYNLLPDAEAAALVSRAIDLGINYIDTAHSYKESERKIGQVMPERRAEIFLATKSTNRTRAGMAAEIEESLRRLRTDRLDSVQIHMLETEGELAAVMAPDGALRAIEDFRKTGTVRFVGVTGHHDPKVLAKALDEYPFDTVLCPMGAVHAAVRPFYETVATAAARRGAGVLGMKVMAYAFLAPHAEAALRYVLGLPAVTSAVVGMDNLTQLEANVAIARQCAPLSEAAQAELLAAAKDIYERRRSDAWFVKM